MEHKTKRAIIDDMLNTFGTRIIGHDGDADEALECLTSEILEIITVDREVAVELLAYVVRRLWFKRSETIKSLN